MIEPLFNQAWAFYFEKYPHVLAVWGHQNGRWPHGEDIPEWYAAHPDCDDKEQSQ